MWPLPPSTGSCRFTWDPCDANKLLVQSMRWADVEDSEDSDDDFQMAKPGAGSAIAFIDLNVSVMLHGLLNLLVFHSSGFERFSFITMLCFHCSYPNNRETWRPPRSQPPTKKMELEDLDGLLDEFGLGGGGSNEELDGVEGTEETEEVGTKGDDDNGDEGGGGGGKKKKKKKKPSAGSTVIPMTKSAEWVKVEPTDKGGEGVNDSETTTTVDVASVLKSKMALKAASNKKSSSEIAVVAAAKEAVLKAARKAEADKKKQKKKNKVKDRDAML